MIFKYIVRGIIEPSDHESISDDSAIAELTDRHGDDLSMVYIANDNAENIRIVWHYCWRPGGEYDKEW